MDETLGRHVNARFERLAQRVRDELAAAGLPVVAPGLDRGLAAGAEVRVSAWNQHFGEEPEVVVSWLVSPRLRGRAVADVQRYQEVTPAIRQSGEAQAAMAAAVIAILSAAGYTARDHGNEYAPFDVLVLAGPDLRTPPAWADLEEAPDRTEGEPAR
ncbi:MULTISPECIES: hypothetical protein [Kitasatospora]|uniref:Uncharacterized protein n=1 Tax=Kitasatospora cathayae TaxID=3004092 RepID=A0ABY7PYJ7_9ACTN|nr:hypothetical protein [Kitasatospora sp. HUAS 3-15]WBP85267.1 hypothetical protein O1G21_04940 [Kitasatospora sp. HUAS 3-15]